MFDEKRYWTIGGLLAHQDPDNDVSVTITKEAKTRFECYAIGLQYGFLTINEVRRLERLPELPEEKAQTRNGLLSAGEAHKISEET